MVISWKGFLLLCFWDLLWLIMLFYWFIVHRHQLLVYLVLCSFTSWFRGWLCTLNKRLCLRSGTLFIFSVETHKHFSFFYYVNFYLLKKNSICMFSSGFRRYRENAVEEKIPNFEKHFSKIDSLALSRKLLYWFVLHQ